MPEGGCFSEKKVLFEGEQARLSPDGRRIVFARGVAKNHDIFVRDLETGVEVRHTSGDADDVTPELFLNGSAIVFSSNRAGSYDLYVVHVGGSPAEPVRLTELKGDETRPRAAPFPFQVMGLRPESCSGPMADQLTQYNKIAFTYTEGRKKSIRFISDDLRFDGLVKDGCSEAEWSDDGLGMLFRCGDSLQLANATVLDPDSAVGARTQLLESQGRTPRDLDEGRMMDAEQDLTGDALVEKLIEDEARPKLFLGFDKPLITAADKGGRQATMSPSQLAWLSVQGKAGAGTLSASGAAVPAAEEGTGSADAVNGAGAARSAAGKWIAVAGAGAGVSDPVWSASGRTVYFTCTDKGVANICSVDASCPLSDVVDLARYPDLWNGGIPAQLTQNELVAMPSPEKEFFHLYEKARYERNGVLVTPDSVLSAFSDVFARELQKQELELADNLEKLAILSFNWASAKLEKEPSNERYRYLAMLFGVPAALLAGSREFSPHQQGMFIDTEQLDEEGNIIPPEDPAPRIAEAVRKEVERFPSDVRKDVTAGLAMLAKQEIAEIENGALGAHRDMLVDFSMARPRGHYTGPRYAQYFQSLSWLGLVPLPIANETIEYAVWLGRDKEALAAWNAVYGLSGALAGPPAIPGTDLLLAAVGPGRDRGVEAVRKAVREAFGQSVVRTLDDALGNEKEVEVYMFPKRVGPDAEVFKATTHPDVPARAFPQAIDLLAALGLEWTEELLEIVPDEPFDPAAWKAAIRQVKARVAARGEGYFEQTVYNRWISMLRTLAAGYDVKGAARFASSEAYRHRLLMGALAGFAQLKHHTVLYSFSNYGVECDQWSPIVLLYEVPMVPQPPVYIEPHVAFYKALSSLCKEAGAMFSIQVAPLFPTPQGCEEEPFSMQCAWYRDEGEPVCPGMCIPGDDRPGVMFQVLGWVADLLAYASEKQLQGRPLELWEYRALYSFGAVLEQLFLGTAVMDSGQRGADQGRLERGIALVTDVYANVQRNLVLHEAVGQPLALYAVAPYQSRRHVVKGGMLSWYEIKDSRRLTDEEWWKIISAPGAATDLLPAWAARFVATP